MPCNGRESFEDEEVAEVLNRDYVSIKVDREERPDVDHIYMSICQTMTGHGGWPLTILMTPDQKPFCGDVFAQGAEIWPCRTVGAAGQGGYPVERTARRAGGAE